MLKGWHYLKNFTIDKPDLWAILLYALLSAQFSLGYHFEPGEIQALFQNSPLLIRATYLQVKKRIVFLPALYIDVTILLLNLHLPKHRLAIRCRISWQILGPS